MARKKSIVFLGYNDFPHGLAEVQKIILISKSLISTGNNVTVICRNGYHNIADGTEIKVTGIYENIKYIYASGSCFRNSNFFKRRLNEIKGKIKEFLLLRKYKKNNDLDCAILSTRNFYLVLYYRILSKILGFKIVLNYVEYYSAQKKEYWEIRQKLNDTLFDTYAPSLSDAVLPISEFLINHINRVSSSKTYLKIPGLTDLSKYDGIETLQNESYFLYCGAAGYKEIILFIIDSFELIENNICYLYLIVNGAANEIDEIKNYINNTKQKHRIKIFSNLTQKELFTYYKNALALLIPLRPTFQDIARFPHKTGEYLASGNPVISTNYGEIKFYFRDGENILLAESYDINLFAEKMQFVINNPSQAKKIGFEGKNMAIKLFDYRYKAKEIDEFLTFKSNTNS
jgi:glycosyltransferase involved in cell wall biosynthesis